MSERYYLDACIWINFFKKEGDASKGLPYWKILELFLDFVSAKNATIYVSTIVLKELRHVLSKELFETAEALFYEIDNIIITKTFPHEYELARKYEKDEEFKISFYDYLHTAISKSRSYVLITRDRDLLTFAKKYVTTFKPEELLQQ